jgi:hypothetical protein
MSLWHIYRAPLAVLFTCVAGLSAALAVGIEAAAWLGMSLPVALVCWHWRGH